MKIFVFDAKVLLLFDMTKYFGNKMQKKCIFTIFYYIFAIFQVFYRSIIPLIVLSRRRSSRQQG